MEKENGFLDDTSLLKTPKSPLGTSTATKGYRMEAFTQKKDKNEMNSIFLPPEETSIQALNEVTNTYHPAISTSQYIDVSESVNSSLGILQMDNFSDFTDNSFQIPSEKNKPISKKKQYNDMKLKESAPCLEKSKLEKDQLAKDISHISKYSDIGDGNHIPHISSMSGSSIPASKATIENRLSGMSVHQNESRCNTIFSAKKGMNNSKIKQDFSMSNIDSFLEYEEASYDNVLKDLLNKTNQSFNCTSRMSESTKKHPVLCMNDSQTDVSKLFNSVQEKYINSCNNKNDSLTFNAKEISAQSSSFGSPTIAPVLNQSDFDAKSSVSFEDLKEEVFNVSLFTKNPKNFKLSGKSSSEVDFPDCSLNFKENSFGMQNNVSDSEFINGGEAQKLFEKDEEMLKEENKFKIGNMSTQSSTTPLPSPGANDVTAPSWYLEMANQAQNQRISINTLFRARTENLGRLSVSSDRERPFFGTNADTPNHSPMQDISSFISTDSTSDALKSSSNQSKYVNSTSISTIDSPNCILRDSMLSQILKDTSCNSPLTLANKLLGKQAKFFPSTKTSLAVTETAIVSTASSDSQFLNVLHYNNAGEIANDTDTQLHNCSSLSNMPPTVNNSQCSPENSNCNSIIMSERKGDFKDSATSSCPNCNTSTHSVPISISRPPSACSSAYSIPSQNQFCNMQLLPSSHELCHNACHQMHGVGGYSHGCCHAPFIRQTLPTQGYHMLPPLPVPAYSAAIFPVPGNSEINLSGPSNLSFPENISIGDTQEISVTVQNIPNTYYYYISFVSASLNETPISSDIARVSYPSVPPCSVGTTTTIPISIHPKYEGKIQVTLQIIACLNPNSISGPSLQTTIQYVAVRPSILIKYKEKEKLNIKSVISGSTVIEVVTVVNQSEVTVPLCISLSADNKDHKISLGLKQMTLQKYPASADWKVLSPKVMFYRLPPSKDGSVASFLDVPIIFEAGKSSGDVNFVLSASIETPTIRDSLAFMEITALVFNAQLFLVRPTKGPLQMNSINGDNSNQSFVVRHEGNFPVVYDLYIDNADAFTIAPASLHMEPNQSSSVSVTFMPSQPITKGTVLAAAQPHGKTFKLIEVIGFTRKTQVPNMRDSIVPKIFSEKPCTDSLPSCRSNAEIMCNRRFIAWGGVDIGCTLGKSVMLKNCSNRPILGNLFIKENLQSFKIVNEHGKPVDDFEIQIKPGEEKGITVEYSPTMVMPSSGYLGIKYLNENGKRVVVQVQLSAYGGIGKLSILNVPEKEGYGRCLDININEKQTTFHVKNIGYRPLFVKVVKPSGLESSSYEVIVKPSEFILLKDEEQALSITCSVIRGLSFCNIIENPIITLFYGDEVLRQQLKKSTGSEHILISGIDFVVPFEREDKVPFDNWYRSTPKDTSLFKSNIKKHLLYLNALEDNMSYTQIGFQAMSSLVDSFESSLSTMASSKHVMFPNGFSPPVKDCSSLPSILSCTQAAEPTLAAQSVSVEKVIEQETCPDRWAISPDELTLDVLCKDSRIVLTNKSNQDLKFKIEYPIEVVSVSPMSGIVSAKNQIGLRIRIIPNFQTKFYENYKGCIKIICDNVEKIVKVNVLKDFKKTKEIINPSENILNCDDSELKYTIIEPCNETIIENLGTLPVQDILKFPDNICLTPTSPGKISETCVRIQNKEKFTIQWSIHYVSLTFSKSSEIPSDAAIFKIIPTSGSLNRNETTIIKFYFSPVQVDSYNRVFEISLNAENQSILKSSFKIEGTSVASGKSNCDESSSVFKHPSILKLPIRKNISTSVFADTDSYELPPAAEGQESSIYVVLKNRSSQEAKLNIVKPKLPFIVNYSTIILRPRKFLKLKVSFKPPESKKYEDVLIFHGENGLEIVIKLKGICHE